MHSSAFFKLFPPPRFLLMPHTGVDVSDDAITFVEYTRPVGERRIVKYGIVPLEKGIVESGDIKDEDRLVAALADVVKKHGIVFAKLSIPEEKAYLFETDVPSGDNRSISQSIEFKLEENIPLSAQDAVFAFDVVAGDHGSSWKASVSAVPRTYIEHMMDVFRRAGIIPLSFETVPRAIARTIASESESDTLIVHAMQKKTGIYVVSQQAVGFTSTISGGSSDMASQSYIDTIANEISRVHSYWKTKNEADIAEIGRVIVVGDRASDIVAALRPRVADVVPVEVADVWSSALHERSYVPPMLKEESYAYAAAAGLAV